MLTRVLTGLCGLALLTACGTSTGDRGLSGGALAGGAAVVVGAAAAPAILIGAGVGALTDEGDINLGKPVWD